MQSRPVLDGPNREDALLYYLHKNYYKVRVQAVIAKR
jgi:hypothetical protein